MLKLPESGLQRSINSHNVNLINFCDWTEANILFHEDEIAGSDLVDLLKENEIYDSQDYAWEFVNDIFSLLRRRSRLFGSGYPFSINGVRATRAEGWEKFPAYSFCLLLCMPLVFPVWAKTLSKDFNEQGELFESLTEESVKHSFAGWTVHKTGWTRARSSQLAAVVNDVASLLGEATGHERWSPRHAKDAGLDIVCFKRFPDERVGLPAYLIQCASGMDWKTKLKTPDLRIWEKIVDFATSPKKAFSMPFALEDSSFRSHTNIADGLLLDRHRLLAPGFQDSTWVSNALTERINAWSIGRISLLPAQSETPL